MNNIGISLPLSDHSERDKAWQVHKQLAVMISQLYSNSQYETYSTRIDNCANYLLFTRFLNGESGELKLKLKRTFLCHVRHCPLCSSARSRVWKKRLQEGIPKMMIEYPTTRFIFLTLTVKNCHITELRDTLNLMSKSFDRLMKRRDVKNVVLGYVRSMEVTRSNIGEAHPHFHVLLAVKPSYFSGNGYITHTQWFDMWNSCCPLQTGIGGLSISACKPNPKRQNDSLGIADSIMEVAKYCVKHTDMIVDKDWLIELTTQLNATKHVVLGGLIKKYVNQKEVSEDEILNGDNDDLGGFDEYDEILFLYNRWLRNYYPCNR